MFLEVVLFGDQSEELADLNIEEFRQRCLRELGQEP
jgi:hypothetical protein